MCPIRLGKSYGMYKMPLSARITPLHRNHLHKPISRAIRSTSVKSGTCFIKISQVQRQMRPISPMDPIPRPNSRCQSWFRFRAAVALLPRVLANPLPFLQIQVPISARSPRLPPHIAMNFNYCCKKCLRSNHPLTRPRSSPSSMTQHTWMQNQTMTLLRRSS